MKKINLILIFLGLLILAVVLGISLVNYPNKEQHTSTGYSTDYLNPINQNAIVINGIPLNNSAWENKTANTCGANRYGFSVSVYPCNVQSPIPTALVQYVNFTNLLPASINTSWVFVYESKAGLKTGKIEVQSFVNTSYLEYLINNSWATNYQVINVINTTAMNISNSSYLCDIGNKNNTLAYTIAQRISGSNFTMVNYCFSTFTAVNASVFLISGNYDAQIPITKYKMVETWTDVTPAFSSIGKCLNDSSYDCYKVNSQMFNAGQSLITKWTYSSDSKNGKWHIFGYEASTPIQTAISSDAYLYLDPTWNSSWSKKAQINITEASGYSMSNYSVLLNITYAASMNSTFSDLRFVNDGENTTLYYWIESYVPSSSARVWVKVLTLPASINTSIYMYYGNPNVASTSNMTTAFLYKTTFQTNDGWSFGTTNAAISGGLLNYTTNDQSIWLNISAISGLSTWDDGYSIEVTHRYGTNDGLQFLLCKPDATMTTNLNTAGIGYLDYRQPRLDKHYGNAFTQVITGNGANSWTNITINVSASHRVDYYFNGTNWTSNATISSDYRTGLGAIKSWTGGWATTVNSLANITIRAWTSPEPNYSIGVEQATGITNSLAVTLTSPIDNLITPNTSISFNFTITPTNANISNYTFYLLDNTTYVAAVYTTRAFPTGTNTTQIILENVTGILNKSYVWGVQTFGYASDNQSNNLSMTITRYLTVYNSVNLTFISNTPANLTNFAGIGGVNYTWEVNSTLPMNASSALMFFKSNSSYNDCTYSINGTNFCGWFNTTGLNRSNLYNFSIYENLVYPGVYMYDTKVTEAAIKQDFTLSNTNQQFASQFIGIPNYSTGMIFEISASNTSATSPSLELWYCNSSWAKTNSPSSNSNCAQMGTILATDTSNHSHGANANDHVVAVSVNPSTGTLAGIKITNLSSVVSRKSSPGGGNWNIKYNSTYNAGAIFTTTNAWGATTIQPWIAEQHFHYQTNSTQQFVYMTEQDAVYPYNFTSNVSTIQISFTGFPPTAPSVYVPVEGLYSGVIGINWTASQSTLGLNISNYTVMLYNYPALTVNQTLTITPMLNATFNSSSLSDGQFSIGVLGTNNLSVNSSIDFSENFTTDNTKPSINILFPLNQSYNLDVSNMTYLATDANLNYSSCAYSIGGAYITIPVCNAGNITGLISNEGTNTWSIRASDMLGNTNVTNVTFSKDSIDPVVNISSPIDGKYYNNNSILINASANDSTLLGCYYSLNGATNVTVTCNSPFYPNNISDKGSLMETDNLVASGTATYDNGLIVQATNTIFISQIIKGSASTKTACAVKLNSTGATLAMGSFSGNYCNINYTLEKGQVYLLVSNGTGTIGQSAGGVFPLSNSDITFILAIFNTTPDGAKRSIIGLNYTRLAYQEGNNSLFFYANDSGGLTGYANVSFYIDSQFPTIIFDYPGNGAVLGSAVTLKVNTTDNYPLNNYTFIINGINFSSVSDTYSTTLSDGAYTWQVFVTDLAGNTNSTGPRTFDVVTAAPNITALYPTNGLTINATLYKNISVNFSVTGFGLDKCWINFAGTLYMPISCSKNFSVNLTNYAQNSYTLYANNTAGITSSLSISWLYSVVESGTVFNQYANETSSQYFEIILLLNTTQFSINPRFIYDGKTYTSNISNLSATSVTLSNIIDVPAVNGTTNKSFYWQLYSISGSNLSQYQTSTREQTVSDIFFGQCNASGLTINALNYSLYEEGTGKPLNGSLEVSYNVWLGNGSTYETFSFKNSNNNTRNFYACINPNANYHVSGINEYYTNGYDNREIFFSNLAINSSSQQFNFYLLAANISDIFTFNVIDQNLNPIINAVVQVLRWDIGAGTFSLVSECNTDTNGNCITNLVLNSVWYKEIVIYNGNVVLVTNQSKESVNSKQLKVNLLQGQFDSFGTVDYALAYNNVSHVFVFTFSDTSGKVATGCLQILNQTPSATLQTSYQCINAAAGTIPFGITANGTYIANAYLQSNSSAMILVDTLTESLGARIGRMLIQSGGYFISVLVVGTLAFIGVAIGSIPVALLLTFGGLVVSNLFQWIDLTSTVIYALIAIGGLLWYASQKKY